jgi:hypothetical protein
MGQSRKKQLDKIFEKYPNKSTVQISKDHGIPYSTVYAYRQKLKPLKPKAEPPKAQSRGFTEAQLIWAMLISFVIGALFVIIMGEI